MFKRKIGLTEKKHENNYYEPIGAPLATTEADQNWPSFVIALLILLLIALAAIALFAILIFFKIDWIHELSDRERDESCGCRCNITFIRSDDVNGEEPFIIREPGLYKLAEDIEHKTGRQQQRFAIKISDRADNVKLDFCGYCLSQSKYYGVPSGYSLLQIGDSDDDDGPCDVEVTGGKIGPTSGRGVNVQRANSLNFNNMRVIDTYTVGILLNRCFNALLSLVKVIKVQGGDGGTGVGIRIVGGMTNDLDNVNVDQVVSQTVASGIAIVDGSTSNTITNSRVTNIVARRQANGYAIRGNSNSLENCEASKILVDIEKRQRHQRLIRHKNVLRATGYSLDVFAEDPKNLPCGNRLSKCKATNIEVVSEINKFGCIYPRDTCRFTLERYGKRDERNPSDDPSADPKQDRDYVPTPAPFLPCSPLTRDFGFAAHPAPPENRAAYDSIAAGILIAQQNDDCIQECFVDKVQGWGIAAGIVVGDGLIGDRVHFHPGVSREHSITDNEVKHIISYFPGSSCEPVRERGGKRNGVAAERIFIDQSRRNVSTFILDKECKNVCGRGNITRDIGRDELEEFLDPHVFGIADIRPDEHNNFIPWFQANGTEKCLDEIVPWFVSDTAVFGNKVIDAKNHWSKICNAFEFFYIDDEPINRDGTIGEGLECEDIRPPDHPRDISEMFNLRRNNNNIRTQLQARKNEGLYWSRDLNVHHFKENLLSRACEHEGIRGRGKRDIDDDKETRDEHEGSGSRNGNGHEEGEFCCDDCPLFQPATIHKMNWAICSEYQQIHINGEINTRSRRSTNYLPSSQETAWCQQSIALMILTTECTEDEIRNNRPFCDLDC